MVQVLPYVPSFLEQITPHINQAIGGISEGYQKHKASQQLRNLLSPPQQIPTQNGAEGNMPSQNVQVPQQNINRTPVENLQIFQAAEKAVGPLAAKSLVDSLLQQQKLSGKEDAEIRSEERKVQAEEKKGLHEKKERQGNIQKTFNVASSLLAKNTPGVGISPGAATGLSRKAVEGRSTFNTLKGKFESILLPMVNKGTLAKERFNFILSQIPDASDSQRAIAGKLRGLAETLSEEGFPIDTKILNSIPWISEDLKNVGQEEQERPPLESFVR